MSKLTNDQLREKLISAIEKVEDTMNEATDENKRTYAANTLSGLIKQYKEMFGKDSVEGEKGKLRSVKNF